MLPEVLYHDPNGKALQLLYLKVANHVFKERPSNSIVYISNELIWFMSIETEYT